MKNDSEMYEIENRYCPICGNFIRAGSPPHHCLDKDLKKIFKDEDEQEFVEADRTYDDKLNEFNEFYNSETYYDNDIEEE
jgi:hypothetical protein